MEILKHALLVISLIAKNCNDCIYHTLQQTVKKITLFIAMVTDIAIVSPYIYEESVYVIITLTKSMLNVSVTVRRLSIIEVCICQLIVIGT